MDVLESQAATSQTPVGPDRPPTKAPSKGPDALRLLTVGVLAFLLATATGRLDLPSVVSGVRDTIARNPAVQTITGNAGSANTADVVTLAAIKDVIQRANDAQAKALAQDDSTLMRETATSSYYQELVSINRDLANSGVTSIALVKIEWGDITVQNGTANATTYETWSTTYDDGSTDQRTDRNEYTLVQQNGAWKIQSDTQPDTQVINPATPGQTDTTQPGTPASISSRSSNWSGYVANGGTFTSVTATWVVPQVAASAGGADATWVGIGGLNSRDLIQAGTQASVGGGSVTYEAWVEMLPQSSRTVSLSVNPGDSVTTTISQDPSGEWTISIKNNTTGRSYSATVQYSSSNSSAEWVQEAPSAGRGLVPLDDFGTLKFTAASAVRDGKSMNLSQLGARAISMINGQGQVIAQPSQIDADGSSFTVTRTSATSTSGGGTNPFRRRGRP
jgi:hypothetical protein